MADSTDYRKWLDRAEQDMKMICIIEKEGIEGIADTFCYICHQAAEKLFKAFLIKKGNAVPKTHDLIFLLGKCGEYDKELIKMLDAVTVLNEYAVSARYPDDFCGGRTNQEAVEAGEFIKLIHQQISILLNKE